MLNLSDIHKPRTLDEALRLLENSGAVVLAGGSGLVASRRRDVQAVVDLSALNMAFVRLGGEAVVIGAMTTLQALSESPVLREKAGGVVARGAHRTAASVLRNQSTLGGTILAEPAGVLPTVLLALDTEAWIASASGMDRVPLAQVLRQREEYRRAILTEIRIPGAALGRYAVFEVIGRTPRDKPMITVCLAAHREGDSIGACAIALGGVGETAVRAEAAEALLSGKRPLPQLISAAADLAARDISPRGDFRASAEYRREMVRVLVRRLLTAFS